ncbi:hypothetical protein BC829DRAFT_397640 [Chytridium lagenaria]|nr:hypothetical protein BC829DRAFT_397640 [Chytridium lagenaria]
MAHSRLFLMFVTTIFSCCNGTRLLLVDKIPNFLHMRISRRMFELKRIWNIMKNQRTPSKISNIYSMKMIPYNVISDSAVQSLAYNVMLYKMLYK